VWVEPVIEIEPLDLLYSSAPGQSVPLPPDLAGLYGELRLPYEAPRWVIGNFVATVDGVVSLNVPGMAGGSEISGGNRQDRLVMGILRSLADAVVVGAGTLRSVPQHFWTAEYVFPDLSASYRHLRLAVGKSDTPLNVIVSGSGRVDLRLPVFSSGKVEVLLVTTDAGAESLGRQDIPPWVKVARVDGRGHIGAAAVLQAVSAARPAELVLVEGGPHLMGNFLAEKLLDELFLTLSPQFAGREPGADRPGLVEGVVFAPKNPLWGRLSDVRRGGSHLFLRYSFAGRS
jgi:riboflavin biosynthesis pyrimidine reductase